MTDNEFDDLNEEAMEAPKTSEVAKPAGKKATKKKAVKKVVAKTVEAKEFHGLSSFVAKEEDKVFDIQFANAIKVGIHQKNYFANDAFDITVCGNIVEIRQKSWEAPTASVFTTLYNVIHWRMESKA